MLIFKTMLRSLTSLWSLLVEAQHSLPATGYWLATHRGQCAHLPAQDAKDKVHDKKSSQDHHWHKVYKLPSVPHRVVDLFRFCSKYHFSSIFIQMHF